MINIIIFALIPRLKHGTVCSSLDVPPLPNELQDFTNTPVLCHSFSAYILPRLLPNGRMVPWVPYLWVQVAKFLNE